VDHPLAVLVAASGAGWESAALQQLAAGAPAIVLLKRCVDLNDLLATATTGQAQVALLGLGVPGLDASSTELLRRAGVGVVLVAESVELEQGGSERARRLGLEHIVDAGSIDTLNDAIYTAGGDTRTAGSTTGSDALEHSADDDGQDASGRAGARMVAVWGPTGAPGRTTVAVGLAAELARRGKPSFLLDVDGYGGAVAQHLGVLDEMSGLLAAARLANTGRLDAGQLVSMARQVDPGFRILTGLPRAERWGEVRDSAYEQVLDLARGLGEVVVLDAGFSLEQDAGASFASLAPRRNAMTLLGLEHADEVVVVGSADPVGLARLARGLVELSETVPGRLLRVVVNRARPALGWGEQEVRAMIDGFVTPASVHFLPDDRAAADQAVVGGRTLTELGDSPLRRGLQDLAAAVAGEQGSPARASRLSRRRAVRGHQRYR